MKCGYGWTAALAVTLAVAAAPAGAEEPGSNARQLWSVASYYDDAPQSASVLPSQDLPSSTSADSPVAAVQVHDGCTGCDGACGQPGCAGCGGDYCLWNVYLGGLYMTRDDGDHYWWSYDDTDESVQLLDTRDARMDWAGGFEARIGRYIGCGPTRIELGYWGLFPDQEEVNLFGGPLGGSLNGILNWDSLDYNNVNADTFVADAQVHRLRRDWEMHNVEINLAGLAGYGVCRDGCGSPWTFNWLTGVRYFRFDDDLQFGSSVVDTVFTGAVEEIFYDVNVDNSLIGWQVGGQAIFQACDRLSLLGGAKVGIYGNRIDHDSRIGGAAGDAIVNNGPNIGEPYNFSGSKDEVSFLAELDLGGLYTLNDCWQIAFGYRVVAVTGIALAADQIPTDLRGVNDLPIIASDGSLVVHGGYAGVTYSF